MAKPTLRRLKEFARLRAGAFRKASLIGRPWPRWCSFLRDSLRSTCLRCQGCSILSREGRRRRCTISIQENLSFQTSKVNNIICLEVVTFSCMHAPQHIIKKTFSHSEEDCGLYPILCIHNIKQEKFLVRLSLTTQAVKSSVSRSYVRTHMIRGDISLFLSSFMKVVAGRSCVLCSVY